MQSYWWRRIFLRFFSNLIPCQRSNVLSSYFFVIKDREYRAFTTAILGSNGWEAWFKRKCFPNTRLDSKGTQKDEICQLSMGYFRQTTGREKIAFQAWCSNYIICVDRFVPSQFHDVYVSQLEQDILWKVSTSTISTMRSFRECMYRFLMITMSSFRWLSQARGSQSLQESVELHPSGLDDWIYGGTGSE